MGFSAWKIWMHPRLTAKVMEEYETSIGELENLRSDLADASELASSLRRELDASLAREKDLTDKNAKISDGMKSLADRIIKIRQQYDLLKKESEGLREEITALRAKNSELICELDKCRDVESRISGLEQTLTRVEEMKERYENRIGRLRAEIVRLREQLGDGNPDADEIRRIDMRNDDEWLLSNF